MSVARSNTVVIDFNILPERPNAAKVHQFLEKEIKLQLSDTENIQLHNIRNCVYIEFKDNETASRYQRLHNNRHIIVHGDKNFKIPVYVEGEAIPVRVHDLPPAMKHTAVIAFLENYGEVLSVTRERWKKFFPGVYNGVRILHMKIKKPIPSVATIFGHTTLITYPGQPKICNTCQNPLQPNQKCNCKTAQTESAIQQASTKALNDKQKSSATPSASKGTNSNENAPPMDINNFPPIIQKQYSSYDAEIKILPTAPNADQNKTNSSDDDEGNNNDDDNDYVDENGSTSPHEVHDGSNKRRMSTKRSKERKKMCSSQCSQNDCTVGVKFSDKKKSK